MDIMLEFLIVVLAIGTGFGILIKVKLAKKEKQGKILSNKQKRELGKK